MESHQQTTTKEKLAHTVDPTSNHVAKPVAPTNVYQIRLFNKCVALYLVIIKFASTVI